MPVAYGKGLLQNAVLMILGWDVPHTDSGLGLETGSCHRYAPLRSATDLGFSQVIFADPPNVPGRRQPRSSPLRIAVT